MVRRNTARENALREAKVRERAAGKKISRNEARGINLGSETQRDGAVKRSQYDPRVGAKNLESMTTRELRAHTRALNTFTSRATQFIAGFAGTPLPRELWNQYKQLEARNNANAARMMERIGNRTLPGQDQTIAGQLQTRQMTNQMGSQTRILQAINRDSIFIRGVDALNKLISSMNKKVQGDYVDRAVGSRMNSGRAILKYSGNEDLIDAINSLTTEQQQLLLDHSEFFNIALEEFNSPDKSEVSQIVDAAYEEHEGVAKNIHVREALMEQLDWVREISPDEFGSDSSRTVATGVKKSRRNRRGPKDRT